MSEIPNGARNTRNLKLKEIAIQLAVTLTAATFLSFWIGISFWIFFGLFAVFFLADWFLPYFLSDRQKQIEANGANSSWRIAFYVLALIIIFLTIFLFKSDDDKQRTYLIAPVIDRGGE